MRNRRHLKLKYKGSLSNNILHFETSNLSSKIYAQFDLQGHKIRLLFNTALGKSC